jgi:hypothetical protein
MLHCRRLRKAPRPRAKRTGLILWQKRDETFCSRFGRELGPGAMRISRREVQLQEEEEMMASCAQLARGDVAVLALRRWRVASNHFSLNLGLFRLRFRFRFRHVYSCLN